MSLGLRLEVGVFRFEESFKIFHSVPSWSQKMTNMHILTLADRIPPSPYLFEYVLLLLSDFLAPFVQLHNLHHNTYIHHFFLSSPRTCHCCWQFGLLKGDVNVYIGPFYMKKTYLCPITLLFIWPRSIMWELIVRLVNYIPDITISRCNRFII